MEVKLFEVRDHATRIPVLAVRMGWLPGDWLPNNPEAASEMLEKERWLQSVAGFGQDMYQQSVYVQLTAINGGSGQSHCDPYAWGTTTMGPVHKAIIEQWEELVSGQVIDARFERGETDAPCESDYVLATS